MLTLFEIHAPDNLNYTKFEVMQIEVALDGKRTRPVSIGRMSISAAISLVVDWTEGCRDCTGWITYRALEHWLASWGSYSHFRETGIDWDPNAGDPDDDHPSRMSTNPIDKALTNAVHGLGRRLAHKALPISVAQVIDAYALASEYDALVAYLKSIDARTAAVML